MKKLLRTCLFIALLTCTAGAQVRLFTLTSFDIEKFPEISAGFVAKDGNGNDYEGLTADDFYVLENGISMQPTLEVDCHDDYLNDVSIALVVDKSTSMLDNVSEFETRWDWLKEGIGSFLENLIFTEDTRVSLIGFAGQSNLYVQFTDEPEKITEKLDSIQIYGPTLYDPPFLNNSAGAIEYLKTRPDKFKRIIIFLTDGNPDEPPEVEKIIEKCTEANIVVFTITLSMPMNNDLRQISQETGGASYEIYTKSDLNSIYSKIALEIQQSKSCYLKWIAPYSCDAGDFVRYLSITFNRQSHTIDRTYEVDESSYAKVNTEPEELYFGNPEVSDPVYLDVVLTPEKADLIINSYEITPEGYFSVSDWDVNGDGGEPPFTIDSGESRTIKVKFNQLKQKSLRTASLILDSKPCPIDVPLYGGLSEIVINNPNEGDIYSTCDEVLIRWDGLDDNVSVDLYYSSDGGVTWHLITEDLFRKRYSWKPPAEGNYLIKAQSSDGLFYRWAVAYGTENNESAYSVDVTNNGAYIYTGGSTEGGLFFNGEEVESFGTTDALLTKYDRDGNVVWWQSAGSPGYDSILSVVIGPDDYVYVTGVCSTQAKFGNLLLNLNQPQSAYAFVAAYPPKGATPKVETIGATSYTNCNARGTKIAYYNDKIYMEGRYKGKFQSAQGDLGQSDNGVFTAIFSPELYLVEIDSGVIAGVPYSTNIAYDTSGNEYLTGFFNTELKYTDTTIVSKGGNDFYLRKYGKLPHVQTQSGSFFVGHQDFTISIDTVIFGERFLHESIDTTINGFITNTGNIPLKMMNINLAGNNIEDFSLADGTFADEILPGDSLGISINFTPLSNGNKSAFLELYGDCSDTLTLYLNAKVICSGLVIDTVLFDPIMTNASKDSLVTTIFTNINTDTILIVPDFDFNDDNSYSINPDDSILVPPDSSIEMTITFAPRSEGLKTALINYNLPDECRNVYTFLSGQSVNSSLAVSILDFGKKRLLSENYDTVSINNMTNFNTVIDSIVIAGHDDKVFTIDPSVSFPYDINANGEIKIPVTFIPEAEKIYSDSILVFYDGKTETVGNILAGQGFLPDISVSAVCEKTVFVNDTSLVFLEITNTDPENQLLVYSAELSGNDAEYFWKDDIKPENLIIAPLSSEYFELIFVPVDEIDTPVDIIIYSDAIDATDDDLTVDTTVQVNCSSFIPYEDGELDFENVIICGESEKPIILSNQDAKTVNCNLVLQGPDADYFSVEPTECSIEAGMDFEVLVTFRPEETRNYTTELLINGLSKNTIKYDISGSGATIKLYTGKQNYKAVPGESGEMDVFAEVPALGNLYLNSFGVKINYYYSMVLPSEISSVEEIDSLWAWEELQFVKPGEVIVSGNGFMKTPYDGKLFTMGLQYYFADSTSSSLYLTPLLDPCTTETSLGAIFEMDGVCFQSGSLIDMSNYSYSLGQPMPSPAFSEIKVQYGVAFDAYTSLQLFNSMGNLLQTPLSGPIKAGNYELDFSVEGLPNGIYYLKYVSANYTKIRKVIICK